MPLRDPQFYRSRHTEVLRWISRRWLFNIPRSRQVEGIRPLGRLAFFDHQASLRSRLQEILKRATAENSLRTAQETTGARFIPGPATVYVVASLSGGTGSGAGLDVAYLLRTILAETKLEYQAIVGVLLTATSAHDCRSEIQNATALACLDELRHFSTPGLGFPGDTACRLPSFDRGPFDQTYVVDLGDGLNEADYQNEAQKVAEYLFRCAATGARGFFEACRRAPQSGGTNRAGTRPSGPSPSDWRTSTRRKTPAPRCGRSARPWSVPGAASSPMWDGLVIRPAIRPILLTDRQAVLRESRHLLSRRG